MRLGQRERMMLRNKTTQVDQRVVIGIVRDSRNSHVAEELYPRHG